MEKDRDYAVNEEQKPPMKSAFIVGCGDIGQRIAALLQQKKHQLPVFGLARSEARARVLEDQGISVISGDLAVVDSLKQLPTAAATIFYLAPPPVEGDTDPLIGHFLQAVSQDALPAKIVLVSTTAVYGDCGGAWINEEQAVHPETARGRRRLDAEQALSHWCAQHGVDWIILRVGGIYGPGRWPLARLQQGLPILCEKESPYTNRIHQDDLAQICVRAADAHVTEQIYNVADGRPGTMSGYFKAIAEHFGIAQPREVSLAEARQVMSAGMLSYLRESRRLDNRKLLDELQVTLIYPDLQAGLAAEIDRP